MSAPRGLWAERYALRVEQTRVVTDLVLETGQELPRSADAQLWDLSMDPALLLRGIPAIGRGVSGAIRGTRPGDGLR